MPNRSGAPDRQGSAAESGRGAVSDGGHDRLLGTGQRMMAVAVAILVVLTVVQASRTAATADDAVSATTGTESMTGLTGYTQRESLGTIVTVGSWLDGKATRRQVQIARALLARRLSTVDANGTTAAELAGPDYRNALTDLDAAWSTAPPGILPLSDRPAAELRVSPALIEFTEQSKHLNDRYQVFASDVRSRTSKAVSAQNRRQLVLLLLTLGTAAVLLVWLARDVRRKYQAASVLEFRATHDGLTGLVNRAELLERVHAAIRQDATGSIALLFIDLDGFKQVNDEQGHRFGDDLLVEVSDRLVAAVGGDEGTTVARLGGDEFVVLCDRVVDPADAESLAMRVVEALAGPVTIRGNVVGVGASVGVALASPDVASPEGLMRDADLAMYEAKRSCAGSYRLFTDDLAELADR